MSRIQCNHAYKDIISLENLLDAWSEFKNGKRKRKDVQAFERNLMENIISLHRDLADKIYSHSSYEPFSISDPKPRSIHKAKVRDRLLHHAIYRKLYPFFDKTFIADSYSCRIGKGSHKAIGRFREIFLRVSKNDTRTCWVLKCDVRKFFASIDQNILISILESYIPDKDIVWLLRQIISSFHSSEIGVGLPLGNLTSQLLVNIYMNDFDQFVKHTIKERYYVRYADDFVFLSSNHRHLESLIPKISDFLSQKLKLTLHPYKVFIKSISSGVDFLGWVHFPDHRVVRTATRKRMLRNIHACGGKAETIQSYLGLVSHGNSWKLAEEIKRINQ